MMQTAVFVDAGYLFAQGSTLLAGSKVSRQRMSLHIDAVTELFAQLAAKAAPGVRLLRIYWYDGLIRGGAQTAEHVALGRAANVKLRLGMVNSRGEQKGVDSLIVTDLIDLARNRAISDAVILSGDEDIRIGVQVTQTHGVRVQLVGVKPALGSQSPDLVAEADPHIELDKSDIAAMLTVAPETGMARQDAGAVAAAPPAGGAEFDAGGVPLVLANELIAALRIDERAALVTYVAANRGALPSDFDRPALAELRDRLGRDLDIPERKAFRTLLRDALRKS